MADEILSGLYRCKPACKGPYGARLSEVGKPMAAQSKTPVKKESGAVEAPRSSGAEVDAFLARLKTIDPGGSGRGRLIFAMDATMSRQPTWDLALRLQADMFRAVKEVGGLDVQLVYFRGFERDPREQMGQRSGGAGAAHDAGSPARGATPRSAKCSPMRAAKASRPRSTPSFMSAIAWKRTSTS